MKLCKRSKNTFNAKTGCDSFQERACEHCVCECTVAFLALNLLSAGIISGRWGYCPVCHCNIPFQGADKLSLMWSVTCSPPPAPSPC